MAVVGTLTPTPVPAGDSIGGVPMMVYHVVITTLTTFTAGTWNIPHGLPYKPTFCVIVPQLADGVAPAATNALVGWCPADTNTTNLAVALLTGTSMTYDVLYG